jgi:redox-sensitive bicupin YhaK (pirin superfamily)
MENIRKIDSILRSKPTIEGAGVHLKRAFGWNEVPLLDPFLLLDDFHSNDPGDYIAGFPWHPHRGIETVTYILDGKVEHEDSIGNKGAILSGDLQWMTAGNGIIHQEMPKKHGETLWGFQLWVNLPASQKMMDPRYRDVKNEQVGTASLDNGVNVKVISGEVEGVRGPVQDIVVDPEYLDVEIPPNTQFEHGTKNDHKVFAYMLEGQGNMSPHLGRLIGPEELVIYSEGDGVQMQSGDEPLRFLLISGKPIGEPVAWHGPIVMNTQEELELAFHEYGHGTFIKHG